MFNHEGPLRARQFVTRKITYNLARLRHSGGQPFVLGDLDASRDWGAAEDYAQAMQLMLCVERPEDLVIATGKLTSVREFLQGAAQAAGFQPVFHGKGMDEVCSDSMSGLELARVSDKYLRHHPTPPLAGDATRLKQLTGWRPRQGIAEVISAMVAADQDRLKKGIMNV
jgi:GDPmannose 4,6-dehydratase